MLKLFLNNTGNCFVGTCYLRIIGLSDVVSHGCRPRKEGSWRSETQLRNHYVDGLPDCVKWPVVYSVTKLSLNWAI